LCQKHCSARLTCPGEGNVVHERERSWQQRNLHLMNTGRHWTLIGLVTVAHGADPRIAVETHANLRGVAGWTGCNRQREPCARYSARSDFFPARIPEHSQTWILNFPKPAAIGGNIDSALQFIKKEIANCFGAERTGYPAPGSTVVAGFDYTTGLSSNQDVAKVGRIIFNDVNLQAM